MQTEHDAPFFSVVCITNKPEILQRDLLPSLDRQQMADRELILLDTQAEPADRASAALNLACSRASGRYLVIAHQDMVFTRPDTLTQLAEECRMAFEQENYGLLGAAGGLPAGGNYDAMSAEDHSPRILPCMTVDECILVLPRAVWQKCPFANLGRTWHAYGVELSLHLREQGLQVGIFHAPVWHNWYGEAGGGQTTDLNYFMVMRKLAWRYRKLTPLIATSCGMWPSGFGYVQVLRRRLPLAVRGALKKRFPRFWQVLKHGKDRIRG